MSKKVEPSLKTYPLGFSVSKGWRKKDKWYKDFEAKLLKLKKRVENGEDVRMKGIYIMVAQMPKTRYEVYINIKEILG